MYVCMYVCMSIGMYACVSLSLSLYIYIYIYTYTYTYAHTRTLTHTHTHTHMFAPACYTMPMQDMPRCIAALRPKLASLQALGY